MTIRARAIDRALTLGREADLDALVLTRGLRFGIIAWLLAIRVLKNI